MGRKRQPVFDGERVNVCSSLCSTCIFRPDSVISRERVREMVESATRNEGAITCHHTLDQKQKAVCRGFFEKHPTSLLQVADRLGYVKYVDPDETSKEKKAS